MKRFEGKTCVITGAASGIGRALAERLASRRMSLVLIDIDQQALQALCEELRSTHGPSLNIETRICDVGKRVEVDRLIADLISRPHGVQLLINNAGVAFYGGTHYMRRDALERMLDINLMGPIRLTHGILPLLEKEPDAHVVNISSFYGLLAWRKSTVYSASKFGLVGFSLGLRQDYPRMGVTVVCPGFVDTALFESACRDFSSEPQRPPKWLTCSADLVARKTISGIRWNRPIVVVTWFARLMWWVTRLMPGLFYRLNGISRIGKG